MKYTVLVLFPLLVFSQQSTYTYTYEQWGEKSKTLEKEIRQKYNAKELKAFNKASRDSINARRMKMYVDIPVNVPAEKLWGCFKKHNYLSYIFYPAKLYLLKPAPGDNPDGVGAIRKIESWPLAWQEEIFGYDSLKNVQYRIIKGIPIKRMANSYNAVPVSSTTSRFVYKLDIEYSVPLSGWLANRKIENSHITAFLLMKQFLEEDPDYCSKIEPPSFFKIL